MPLIKFYRIMYHKNQIQFNTQDFPKLNHKITFSLELKFFVVKSKS